MAQELARRGHPTPVVFVLRIIAGLGLWWNLLAWEWGDLDLMDVLFGWGINFGLLAALLIILTPFTTGTRLFLPLLVALLSFLALSVALLYLARMGWATQRQRDAVRPAKLPPGDDRRGRSKK